MNANRIFRILLVALAIILLSSASGQFNEVSAQGALQFTQISAGEQHTCGITSTGKAYCWGNGLYGQLGDGDIDNKNTPTPVSSSLVFTQISAGGTHACAVTIAGEAYCWGNNSAGQLGDSTTIDKPVPTLVTGGLNFISISAGLFHTCSLSTTNQVYCWGLNSKGQLGDSTTIDKPVPTLVVGGLNFDSMSTGGQHTCAIAATNAYCWGQNGNGRLGNGTTTDSAIPTLVSGGLNFSMVSSGTSHTCGVSTTNQGYCWGMYYFLASDDKVPTLVSGGLNFSAIDSGGEHSCGVTTSGTYCWGNNATGELGDSTNTMSEVPTPVSGVLNFSAINAGDSHTCGIVNGKAYCWGWNYIGQLGNGTNTDSNAPVPVSDPIVTPGTNGTVILVHGWLGAPGSYSSSCEKGVIEYTGSSTDEVTTKYWGSLPNLLYTTGIRVFVAHIKSGPGYEGTSSIESNAECLKNQVNQVLAQISANEKISIIAHSMGGLVSRACIEVPQGSAAPKCAVNRIKNLFTMGTPHQGLPNLSVTGAGQLLLGFSCLWQSVACDMAYPFINLPGGFNTRYPNRNSAVKYYVIGGDLDASNATPLGRVMLSQDRVGFKFDAIVGTASSIGLTDFTQSYISGEAHNGLLGTAHYFTPTSTSLYPESYQNCLQPVLLGTTSGCIGGQTLSLNAQSTPPQANTFVVIQEGQLGANGGVSASVNVDSPGFASFGTTLSTGATSLILTSPTGQVIDEAYANANPLVVSYQVTSAGVVYTFNAVETGLWTLSMSHATTQLEYSLFAAFNSNIVISTQVNKVQYTPGETMVIGVSSIAPPDTLVGVVEYSDGSSSSVTFTQNATTYAASHVVLDTPGYGVVRITAVGMNGGTSYTRVYETVFEVLSGTSGQQQFIFLPIVLK